MSSNRASHSGPGNMGRVPQDVGIRGSDLRGASPPDESRSLRCEKNTRQKPLAASLAPGGTLSASTRSSCFVEGNSMPLNWCFIDLCEGPLVSNRNLNLLGSCLCLRWISIKND